MVAFSATITRSVYEAPHRHVEYVNRFRYAQRTAMNQAEFLQFKPWSLETFSASCHEMWGKETALETRAAMQHKELPYMNLCLPSVICLKKTEKKKCPKDRTQLWMQIR